MIFCMASKQSEKERKKERKEKKRKAILSQITPNHHTRATKDGKGHQDE
jgi:hypothetical protein